MINIKEKIKWRGDLKETTGLIQGQVSSLKKETGLCKHRFSRIKAADYFACFFAVMV